MKKKKKLVIVESPAKAKTINKYLGTDYVVKASMGHIRDLPKSKIGVDIEDNFNPQYVIPPSKKKTVTELKKAAKDISHIYLAADPDREGEAICWHLEWILSQVAEGVEIKRVTFNEITLAAIKEAFKHPREIDTNLVNAQQARRVLDRLVGYQLSPLLWKKVARGLSAGRVQSVALKLIIEREREIRAFVPEEYWSLEAEFSRLHETACFLARLDKINGEKIALGKKEAVDGLLDELKSAGYVVSKVEEKPRKRKPQPPFITSKLQQEAYNKLRFPALKTMRIAQKLYEGVSLGPEGMVGLITYMRTDSVSISQTAMEEVRTYIGTTFGNEYLSAQPIIYKSRKGAQEAHEAIRPTATERTPEAIKEFLEEDELALYALIWKRFVSSQMSEAEDVVRTVEIEGNKKFVFRTNATTNVFPGFTKVYIDTETEKEDTAENEGEKKKAYLLPALTVGETVTLRDMFPEQHFTKPPARFNDASLVKLLEELGIGRPSTYAPTIQTLLSRTYVERQSGALFPTEMGELVLDLLIEHFSSLLDVQFTARMEDELDEVEEGKKEWHEVLREFNVPFSKQLADALVAMKDVKKVVIESDYLCDICGRRMVVKWGRFGKFLACPGFPDCKYTKSIPTGYRCIQEGCDGELVRRQTKTKRVFYGCSNYPRCTYTVNRLPDAPGQEKASE